VDDFSRYTGVYPLKRKSDFLPIFCAFQKLVENLFNTKIKMFQSDGGREFDNTSLGAHFLERGVYFRKSCPETQPQNGVAEHKHRHLNEIARSFLVEAHMPATFWVEAIQTVVFVANRLRLPTPNLQGHSPFEKLFHRLPAYNFLKSFGCPLLPKFFSHFCE